MAANNFCMISGIVDSVTLGSFGDNYKAANIKLWTLPTAQPGQDQKVYNSITVRVLGRMNSDTSAADRAMELQPNQAVLVQGELIKDETPGSFGYMIAADSVIPVESDQFINVFTGAGNLGQDCETRFTQSGKSVSKFSTALSRIGRDSQPTWINCEAWDSERVASYMTKGTTVAVQGQLKPESWKDQDRNTRHGMKISINGIGGIRLLGGRRNDDGGAAVIPTSAPVIPTTAPTAPTASSNPAPVTADAGGVNFDLIPF